MITLGDSSKLQTGERAIAIGNALGYGQSVTGGYISEIKSTGTVDRQDNDTDPDRMQRSTLEIVVVLY